MVHTTWLYHLNTGHSCCPLSDESGIQVLAIQMVTLYQIRHWNLPWFSFVFSCFSFGYKTAAVGIADITKIYLDAKICHQMLTEKKIKDYFWLLQYLLYEIYFLFSHDTSHVNEINILQSKIELTLTLTLKLT